MSSDLMKERMSKVEDLLRKNTSDGKPYTTISEVATSLRISYELARMLLSQMASLELLWFDTAPDTTKRYYLISNTEVRRRIAIEASGRDIWSYFGEVLLRHEVEPRIQQDLPQAGPLAKQALEDMLGALKATTPKYMPSHLTREHCENVAEGYRQLAEIYQAMADNVTIPFPKD